MGYAAPPPSEMFSDSRSGTEVAERFEIYKSTLSECHKRAAGKNAAFVPGQGIVAQPQGDAIAGHVDAITKGLSPDVLAGVQSELEALKGLTADIGKDWSVSFPNSAGLVPVDLEAPAKLLMPRVTPLRNSIPRGKGQGTARQFKRILGWSNSGVGGVADQMAFMNSEANPGSANFGALSLRRGAKINYASDSKSVAYVEQGLSDMVTWKAQFAGQGFQDIRSLSQTALLWATMGAEERALLYGRGAGGNGYLGTVAAPTCTVAATGTAGTIPSATYGVKITSAAGGGESAPAVVSAGLAVTLGQTVVITFTGGTEPNGALTYNVYVGPAGSETYQGTFSPTTAAGTTTITLSAYAAGGAPFPAADSTFNANGYDGFLSVLSDPNQTGYLKRVNTSLTGGTTPIGDGPFQDAFAGLYGAGFSPGNVGNPAVLAGNKLLADPDEVWVDGNIRRALGDYLKKSATSSAYRIALTQGEATGGATVGSVVNGIANQVTGKMVDLAVHPYMVKGAAMIRSRTLPVPDSEVSTTSEVINVQDYMAVEWPVIQYTYDQSTYMFGTLVHYAPAWSGLLLGLSA